MIIICLLEGLCMTYHGRPGEKQIDEKYDMQCKRSPLKLMATTKMSQVNDQWPDGSQPGLERTSQSIPLEKPARAVAKQLEQPQVGWLWKISPGAARCSASARFADMHREDGSTRPVLLRRLTCMPQRQGPDRCRPINIRHRDSGFSDRCGTQQHRRYANWRNCIRCES